MPWRFLRLLLLLLLLGPAATAAAPAAPVLAPELDQRLAAGGPWPAEGVRVIVKLRADAEPAARAAAARPAQVAARQQAVLDALPPGRLRGVRRHQLLWGFAGWADREALEALAADPDVERVYPDGRVHASIYQGRKLVGGDAAGLAGFNGGGVTVAVLDTGIDTDHPDLSDDLLVERCFCDDHPSPSVGCCPGGGQSQSGAGAAEDDDGHGTAVTGIVTARGFAVPEALAWKADIAAVKVLDAAGGGSFSDIDSGLDWVLSNAASYGIRIVNLSFGDGIEYTSSATFPCSGSVTADAIADLVAAGITVVVASGNEAFAAGISFPACAPAAISVGGVYDAALGTVNWCGSGPSCSPYLCSDSGTQPDTFVCHANSGPLLDVLAPDWRTSTTAVGGGALNFGGTSAAAPYVAAEAALLYQADPLVSPAQVRSLLKGHGPLITNPANGLAFRRADVSGALTELIGGPDPDGDGVPDDGDGSGTPGDGPCADGVTVLCDDSCPADFDPTQADSNGNGIGDVCEIACSNGEDDDGDGLLDFPDDPGCSSAGDLDEQDSMLPCDNGLDDDGDGAVDVADPGCRDAFGTREDPQCNDGLDNDGDGGIDYDGAPADAQCLDQPWRNREAASSGSCGLGWELALLLPALRRARRRRRIA